MDQELNNKIKYYELWLRFWYIRSELWHEYPDKMRESTNKFARRWLDAGLIKCKHEQ